MTQKENKLHFISPSKVIRGESAWKEGQELIPSICKKPLLIGRSKSTSKIRNILVKDLENINIRSISRELKKDCCEEDLNNLYKQAKKNSCDGVIASGGGKVLDAGKLLGHRLGLPVITIPLSAATCAGWTALSNIYSPEGAFINDVRLDSCPNLLIFDYEFIRQAPSRTLASGIADALAKWYEASATSSASSDGLAQQAVQMARVLRDQLFIDGYKAFEDNKSDEWIRVAEACALTAGLIGGIGGTKCRTAAAHAIHNGLTQLEFEEKPLHGELVGFGILIQLHLEELKSKKLLASQSRIQVSDFLRQFKLPIDIESIKLKQSGIETLREACDFATRSDSDIHNLPFKVDTNELLNSILINKTSDDLVSPLNMKER